MTTDQPTDGVACTRYFKHRLDFGFGDETLFVRVDTCGGKLDGAVYMVLEDGDWRHLSSWNLAEVLWFVHNHGWREITARDADTLLVTRTVRNPP